MKSFKNYFLSATVATGMIIITSACNTQMKSEQATDSVMVNDEMQPIDSTGTEMDTTTVDTATVTPMEPDSM